MERERVTSQGTALAAVLQRDRLVVLSGLAALSALAWTYLGRLSSDMESMADMAMPRLQAAWEGVELIVLFVMWAVMMVAMMVPTAAPMILVFAAINRRRRAQERPFVPTLAFLAGYVLVWTGFSGLATLAQWGLHEAALLSPMMVSTSPLLGGGLLIAAGLFQWTPLKHVCLAHCRSPLGFVTTEWREGVRGALVMGLRHGGYCTGCCWALMALLFVAGMMNLLWLASIMAFVLVEKIVPRGDRVGRIGGGVLILAGLVLLGEAWS